MLLAYFHIYELAPGAADKDTEKKANCLFKRLRRLKPGRT
jgi:hypothetical protein